VIAVLGLFFFLFSQVTFPNAGVLFKLHVDKKIRFFVFDCIGIWTQPLAC
jgi:hypothetical protein